MRAEKVNRIPMKIGAKVWLLCSRVIDPATEADSWEKPNYVGQATLVGIIKDLGQYEFDDGRMAYLGGAYYAMDTAHLFVFPTRAEAHEGLLLAEERDVLPWAKEQVRKLALLEKAYGDLDSINGMGDKNLDTLMSALGGKTKKKDTLAQKRLAVRLRMAKKPESEVFAHYRPLVARLKKRWAGRLDTVTAIHPVKKRKAVRITKLAA